MKYFSMLIKPASSTCNMKCRYCFYNDVADHREVQNCGIMNNDVISSIVDKTIGYFKEPAVITYAFQGGEPTCAGLDTFKKFVDEVNKRKQAYHTIHYAIQTNGTLLNEEWYEFFKKNHFLVGLSIDGFQRNHDHVRIDGVNNGTFEKVLTSYHKMIDAGIEVNILTVLTDELTNYPVELYEFYKQQNMKYIQLIPCLPGLDGESDYACTPTQFAKFYSVFYDEWEKEVKQGVIRSVSFFENYLALLSGNMPHQCGYLGFCNMQFVVEADGSVYPCDFYVLDKYLVGNIKEDTIVDMAKSKIVQSFKDEEKSLCSLCKTCEFWTICHGNCKRMNVCYYDSSNCGIQLFLKEKKNNMIQIIKSFQ